ncbi:hypothetical protein GO299_04717 [Ralstonia solanacearum]|nr:hypothetical protein [Ralstonia solanacearum]NKF72409.1 hypothetical protein [Ralstonia solanacearum]
MTPEREAQMRDAFEREFAHMPLRRGELKPDSYWCPTTACAWDAWLACARALEPMVMEETFDAAIEKCEEWAHHLSQFDAGKSDVAETCAEMIRELKDAAMSAALEDGNADV